MDRDNLERWPFCRYSGSSLRPSPVLRRISLTHCACRPNQHQPGYEKQPCSTKPRTAHNTLDHDRFARLWP